ncbi:hypothetical protein Chor_007448 [Crotalus horridus]
MSWNPQYRSSKFRHVYGKAASKENCYDNVPITQSVYDNQFCAVNPRFIAVVTECAGGGAFVVIPISHTGKLDPHYPRICGHKGNVLDIKWNPFDDFVIASCSEDTTVKVWNIPQHLLTKSIIDAQKDLLGHSRRVGLIEWHPTASNILFSTGYDYKVMIWNLDTKEHTIQMPVKTIGFHTNVILSMSFNTDGSLLATVCRDRKIRIIDPRAGTIFQAKGTYAYEEAFKDETDDLSVPLHEEDVDGSSGLLFPFYDTDTHMLYVLSKGDGNIRYYEINVEKPYLHYLMEYRSPFPQKGIGVMPKRGLDVCACEIFRFYKLIPGKSLIEPISMIVPRRSESYQEDIYPMTAGVQPALTAQDWLNGTNKGPVLMSLRPGSVMLNSLPPFFEKEIAMEGTKPIQGQDRVIDTTEKLNKIQEKWGTRKTEERQQQNSLMKLSNGVDAYKCPPPKTENELLQMFYRQQEEIRRLREVLIQRDIQIKQLQLEIKNLRVDSHRF